MTSSRPSPAPRELPTPKAQLIADLLRGLRSAPKRLSPAYFYDDTGSVLFDRICELPEYYLTRTEASILETHGDGIAQRIGQDSLLVELGSGASHKTRALLDRLPGLCGYVPIDISRSHLIAAAHRISAAYPQLEVLPVCADFTRALTLPKPKRRAARTVVFFPGSTLGNFDQPAARALMHVIRATVGPGGAFVVGIDLVKDAAILENAYNDSAGVTAQFNLNILKRLNREFDADFDPASFSHEAVWVPAAERIEMRLVSARPQLVRVAGETIAFDAGERLVTEHCHKYTQAGFADEAAACGWSLCDSWMDPAHYFCVAYLEGR